MLIAALNGTFIVRMLRTFYLCIVTLIGGGLPISHHHNRKLTMWIDENVIQKFFGVPYEIYIIKDGSVIPYLKTPRFFEHLPPIPGDIYLIKLTWLAGKKPYWYFFSELKSLDTSAMYDPLLSIPSTGKIPDQQTSFEIAIPCTGRSTDIARLQITLHINDKYGRAVEGSPLKLVMRKQCTALKKVSKDESCSGKCTAKGKCNERGECVCKFGYHGTNCEKEVKCDPKCLNGGQCIAPGKCDCHVGFYGAACQYTKKKCKPICKNGGKCIRRKRCKCKFGYYGKNCRHPYCQRICGPHGRCVAPDMCRCDFGWHGRYCNKRHRSPSLRMLRRMKNRRARAKRERRKRRRQI